LLAKLQDVGPGLEPRIRKRPRGEAETNERSHQCYKGPRLARSESQSQTWMHDRLGTTAEQREIHAEHGETGQRRRDDDSKSHDREDVDGAVDKQLLANKAKRPRKAGAPEAHGKKGDRQ